MLAIGTTATLLRTQPETIPLVQLPCLSNDSDCQIYPLCGEIGFMRSLGVVAVVSLISVYIKMNNENRMSRNQS